MIPALGTIELETRHLNLKWSVADVDRIVWLASQQYTAGEISKRFGQRGMTKQDVEWICRNANPSIYLYSRSA